MTYACGYTVKRGGSKWTPVNITAMVVGFVLFWPIGLIILFYILNGGDMGHLFNRAKDKVKESMSGSSMHAGYSSTGNSAFDAYREETLKRLREEQEEFAGFMARLQKARDKAEFDQFMSERNSAAK